MRKISIRPKKLYQLAKEFLRSRPISSKNSDGGRPKEYPDALILTIASVQKLGNLSFRQSLEYCGTFFSDVPSLSSYHERLEGFPQKIRRDFIVHLGT